MNICNSRERHMWTKQQSKLEFVPENAYLAKNIINKTYAQAKKKVEPTRNFAELKGAEYSIYG